MAIPQTMKAAILVEQRKPLVIDEVQLPQTLEVGQVISATVTLIVSLLVVSLTLPYLKQYAPIRGAARSS